MESRRPASPPAGSHDRLYASIDRELDRVGIDSRPEVAARVLELVANESAGMRDFAEVIRADAALTGRLLRLANSALFAQRQPVTTVERACVLLGLERLRAVALGFYLSRAAASGSTSAISRRIWAQSVYRACLASELARRLCPSQAAEAFVIGLMLDCGLPLLLRLAGKDAQELLAAPRPPAVLFRLEQDRLPYTHVDVAAALMRRWRIPPLLARPIERHHTDPGPGRGGEPQRVLERLAYYVGAIHLAGEGGPGQQTPQADLAARVLELPGPELSSCVHSATRDFRATRELFADIADNLSEVDRIMDDVQRQLAEVMDETLAREFRCQTRNRPERFHIGDSVVEVAPGDNETLVAYLLDSRGRRLLAYEFLPEALDLGVLAEALGLEADAPGAFNELADYVRSAAA